MPVAEAQPKVPPRKPRGGVVPNRAQWYQRVAARLAYTLIRSVSMTLRYRWIDRSDYLAAAGSPGPGIYCVWHNRLALCLEAYFGYVKKHNQAPGMAAMVSASKDGALLASVLECYGVQPVRGSSSRRGSQALLELTTWSERGYDLAITPDGPRGPRYVAQDGAISLAQLTGLPIMPVSYHLSRKIQVKSWDRFQIPLPFCRCEMIFEKPIYVPRESSEEEREKLRLQLEQTLQGISKD